MPLTMIQDDGMSRRYRLQDEREVIITIDEDDISINVTTPDGKHVGKMEMSHIEDDFHSWYKIKWMYMDLLDESYKRKGIGRECIRFFEEITGDILTAEYDDGIPKNDGSHLTQDAPAFVSQMRKEGLISGGNDDDRLDEPE